jgi:hypothetical protein
MSPQQQTPQFSSDEFVGPTMSAPAKYYLPNSDIELNPDYFEKLGMCQEDINDMINNATDTDVLFMSNAQFSFNSLGAMLTPEQILATLYVMKNYSNDKALETLHNLGFESKYVFPYGNLGPADFIVASYNQAVNGVSVGYEVTKEMIHETKQLMDMTTFVLAIAAGQKVEKMLNGNDIPIPDNFKGFNLVESGMEVPKNYLDKALQKQGLSGVPAGMKQSWIEGGYKYEVRVHAGENSYTNAQSVYRVSRQQIPTPGVEGTGTYYLGTDSNWYHTSVLKPTNVLGESNPFYNANAASITHISLP